MHPNHLRRRSVPLLLTAVLGLAACGDDTVEPGVIDFDAMETALEEGRQPFLDMAPANAFLADALAGLASHGVVLSPVEPLAYLEPLGYLEPLMALAPLDAGAAVPQPKVEFPAEVLGRTFVFDGGANAWEIDEERTGAPASGIRVIWYATDGTGNPIDSEEIGYFDLTDEDSGGLSVLGIMVVSSEAPSQPLADYDVGYLRVEDGSAWSEDIELDGYIRDDAARPITFHFSADGSGSATGDTTYAFDVGFQSPDVTYEYLHDAFEPAAGDATTDLTVRVVHGGATTQLEMALSGSAGSGVVRHQGALVANLATTNGMSSITYSTPDGGAFSAPDRARLQNAVTAMMESVQYVLVPVILLVPAWGA